MRFRFAARSISFFASSTVAAMGFSTRNIAPGFEKLARRRRCAVPPCGPPPHNRLARRAPGVLLMRLIRRVAETSAPTASSGSTKPTTLPPNLSPTPRHAGPPGSPCRRTPTLMLSETTPRSLPARSRTVADFREIAKLALDPVAAHPRVSTSIGRAADTRVAVPRSFPSGSLFARGPMVLMPYVFAAAAELSFTKGRNVLRRMVSPPKERVLSTGRTENGRSAPTVAYRGRRDVSGQSGRVPEDRVPSRPNSHAHHVSTPHEEIVRARWW